MKVFCISEELQCIKEKIVMEVRGMHAQLKAYPKSVYVLSVARLGCSFTCLIGEHLTLLPQKFNDYGQVCRKSQCYCNA
jgi:hypothetical protein